MESGVVAGPEHISGKPLIATCGTAMDYNKIDFSGHIFFRMSSSAQPVCRLLM
jgi:hypothetical protein